MADNDDATVLRLEMRTTLEEIGRWALARHRDALGDHLDLSDAELQKIRERLEETR